MTIKIGLLLDSMQVPVWQRHVITFLKSNPSFSIQLIVLNNSGSKNSASNFIYTFFKRMDRKLFTTKNDCFQRVNIAELVDGIAVNCIVPLKGKFTDEIPESDIAHIKSKELDVIIRFGFRILKGEILNAAKYGVWSLHHGDNAVNRGGPPAFWEVVNKEPVTGVTLQVLSNDLDGGTVIDKAFVRTDRTSFNRNQNTLFWAGVELFCNALARLSLTSNPSPRGEGQGVRGGFYSHPLYRNPGVFHSLYIFSSFWIRRIKEIVFSIFTTQQWSLLYKFNKTGSFETSLFRYQKLIPPKGVDWADPFVVWKEKSYYLFFEELIRQTKRAHISCLEFDNHGKIKSTVPVKVLSEPWHLSYPFIFEFEHQHFMIPESAENKNVWLYKCEKFPDQWKRHQLLLKDVSLYDPTLIFHNNVWYLFGTQKPLEGSSPDQYLYIYYAENLFTESWKLHPQNPVTRDVRGARPAGKIFKQGDKLIRPSQIGAPKYGYGIRFHEIIRLAPDHFEERIDHDILPHWKKGILATHTFNHENGFSVLDVQQ